MMHVTRRPIGGSSRNAEKKHATSVRIQAEIAMCFAWGTAMHPHTSSIRRPLCCVYTMTDCRSYVCIDHYTFTYDVLHISRDQDWDAASAHAGTGIGQPPSPPRDSGAALRQASCHHTDVRDAQAGGPALCVLASHIHTRHSLQCIHRL